MIEQNKQDLRVYSRPMIEKDSDLDYSTLSELTGGDFDSLFNTYMHITCVIPPISHEMSLKDFLEAIKREADNRGYFD